MLKTKELTAFSSLTQSKGTWTDSDETNLPVSDLRICIDTSVSQNRASNKYFFATFHRLHFIHSPGTREFMIMEEEVDDPSKEKGSMMNYTKNQRQ